MCKKLSILLLGIGVLCFAAFDWIGSSVDENGFLHEPFGLMPVGYLALLMGVISGLVCLIKNRDYFRKNDQSERDSSTSR